MTQCDQCRHDGIRGGVVTEPHRVCQLLEEQGQGRLGWIVERLCQLAAAEAKCPAFEEIERPPDSYRSQDLPRTPRTTANV